MRMYRHFIRGFKRVGQRIMLNIIGRVWGWHDSETSKERLWELWKIKFEIQHRAQIQ